MSLVLKLLNVSNQICLNNLKIHFKDKVYLTRRQKIAEFLLVCKVQKFTSKTYSTNKRLTQPTRAVNCFPFSTPFKSSITSTLLTLSGKTPQPSGS